MTNFKLLLFKLHSPRVMQKSISASLQVVKFSAVLWWHRRVPLRLLDSLYLKYYSQQLCHMAVLRLLISAQICGEYSLAYVFGTHIYFKLPLILQMLLRLGPTNEVQKRELLASVRVYPKSKDWRNYFKKNNSKQLFVLTSWHLWGVLVVVVTFGNGIFICT